MLCNITLPSGEGVVCIERAEEILYTRVLQNQFGAQWPDIQHSRDCQSSGHITPSLEKNTLLTAVFSAVVCSFLHLIISHIFTSDFSTTTLPNHWEWERSKGKDGTSSTVWWEMRHIWELSATHLYGWLFTLCAYRLSRNLDLKSEEGLLGWIFEKQKLFSLNCSII